MTVLGLHESAATVYSAFGNTEVQAKTSATALAKQLTQDGHFVAYENHANKCRDGVYAVSILAKKKYYK